VDDLVVFQTILVGTDGSATARIAEHAATLLARATSRQLVVVSAFDGSAGSKLAAEEAVKQARGRVEEAGLGAWSEVVEGEPAAALVEFADRVNAELIVIGDVGMGEGGRLRLGGVPDRISHAGPVQRPGRAHREPRA
jgi:nucleotide-binding universal stress UspA family protein